jgi:hypothetical protein
VQRAPTFFKPPVGACSAKAHRRSTDATPAQLSRGECALIKITSTEPSRLGNIGGGILESRTGCDESDDLGDAIRETDSCGSRTSDNENDLAARAIPEVVGEFSGGSPTNFFVKFREFATHGNSTINTESRRHISESCGEPIRRLEEHHRSLLTSQCCEVRDATLARKKPLEAEPIRRKTAQDKRSENRTGSRQNSYLNTGLGGSDHKGKTRVADRRHSSIRKDEHILITSQLNDFGGTLVLVVFVKCHKTRTILNA